MKIKVRDFIITIITLLLIFQSPLTLHTDGIVSKFFSSIDELIAIFLFGYSIIKMKFDAQQKKIFHHMILLFIIGLLGTILYNLQPTSAVLSDMITNVKFFFIIIGSYAFFRSNDDNERTIIGIKKKVSMLSVAFFVIAILSYFIQIPFINISEYRFGIKSLQLFYYHPALLSQIIVFFLAILSYKDNNEKNDKYFIVKLMCLIMLCLTLRTKSICFALVYLIINKYDFINKKAIRKILTIFILILSVAFLAKDSVDKYYGSMEETARGKMTVESIKIAKNKFPIGYGYATYGTYAAVTNYSPIYRELGFNNIYGLGRISTNYATDTFWPAILGEFGILGLLTYISFIIFMIKNTLFSLNNKSKYSYLIASLLAFMLIISTASSSFINPISILYGIYIGLSIYETNKSKKEV